MNETTDRLLELLSREGPALHTLLSRLTLDRHAAEDLLQEVFLKLTASPAFREAARPHAYLRQSAINLALDWRRARRNKPVAMATDVPDPASPANAATELREEWNKVLDAATELNGLTREVFVLHYLEEQSFTEIATLLGKTPHQVRGLCHKAIRYLREKLTPQTISQEGSHAP